MSENELRNEKLYLLFFHSCFCEPAFHSRSSPKFPRRLKRPKNSDVNFKLKSYIAFQYLFSGMLANLDDGLHDNKLMIFKRKPFDFDRFEEQKTFQLGMGTGP